MLIMYAYEVEFISLAHFIVKVNIALRKIIMLHYKALVESEDVHIFSSARS